MNKTDTTYQGWSNHATWCVALHINNDQAAQADAQAMRKHARNDAKTCQQVKDGIWKADDAQRYIFADRLQLWMEEEVVDSYPSNGGFADGLRLDLLPHYLAQTNWDELARSFLGSEATG